MIREVLRAAALLLAASAHAACAHAGRPLEVPAPPAPAAPPEAPARYFLGAPDESFWVSREPGLDRVVAGGVRLELGQGGEVKAAGWDPALGARAEAVLGALAVPERLGGGFVVWTGKRVFRAREFTGPLSPVALRAPGDVAIRGARPGLASVVVLTDSGPWELLPGADRLTPLRDPAVLDLGALSAERAARFDVFGRISVTADGGARWTDLSAAAGVGVRQMAVGPRDLVIDGAQGRFLVDARGKLEPADAQPRWPAYDQPRAFQMAWRTGHEHDDWPYSVRESSPFAVAVSAGGDVGDGSALGVSQGTVMRVDLATGALLALSPDWIPGGLDCQPVRAPDGVLFACAWDRGQGYGGYVLRSVGGGPPQTEKAFGEDGSFVASDDGAIGFVGPCRSEPRVPDPNDQSRWEAPRDVPLGPVFCARKGPGLWVEHRVDPGEGNVVAAWIPRRDGTAVALVLSSDPLPPPAGARRVVDLGDVRLVRVYPEIPGRAWQARAQSGELGTFTSVVDRRFRVREDGSVDAWLLSTDGAAAPAMVSVTLDPEGVPTVNDPPPRGGELVLGGSSGLSLARDGALHETRDHGRTWRPAGVAPALPALMSGGARACSPLGCSLGPVVRLGWGAEGIAPRVSTTVLSPPDPAPRPRLVCAPRGDPEPLAAPPTLPPSAAQTLSTGWGETLQMVHDNPADAPRPAGPSRPPVGSAPGKPRPPASPKPSGKPAQPPPTPAVKSTQTLVVRPPLSPFAAPRRLNATNAVLDFNHRTMVVPLLAPSGDVDLLVIGNEGEALISGDHLTPLPIFETRRYGSGDPGFTGLSQSGGRALILGDVRRRLSMEDHGPGPVPPPLFLGFDRAMVRRRTTVLARRDDGAVGVIVADGAAPETAGVALLDRFAAGVGTPERLAPWSSLLSADDPRCGKGGDPRAWRALLVIDPSTWLDAGGLPGVAFAHQGLLQVRWGRDRVCLEAVDAAVTEAGRRGEAARSWSLAVRWIGERDRGAVLRAADLRQALVCRIEGQGG